MLLKLYIQYSVFVLIGFAILFLTMFVVEKGIDHLDTMLIPCQHGTSFIQGKCRCDGTPFNGTFCSECICEHGICSTDPTTPYFESNYGCRCPSQTKRFGFLCEICNTIDAIDDECKSDCKPDFFGNKCEKICYADLEYNNNNSVCNTLRDAGGKCSLCHGHGTCENGECECDKDWFDKGRLECFHTCPGTPMCSGHGACELYGNTPGCVCEDGWNGIECNLPCPGMVETGKKCNGNGICNVDLTNNTATCECLDKYRGNACELECPGDIVPCNGHGTCDDLGVCSCDTNVKWSLPSCKCSDELTCNLKGECNDQEICDCFGHNSGGKCLDCETNWHGENCDMFCDPHLKKNGSFTVENDFGCFGHGTCLVENNQVQCTCNLDTTQRLLSDGLVNDFTSFYDPEMNCGECEINYFPKQYVYEEYGPPPGYVVPCENTCEPSTCNHHGVCNHDYGVPGEKLCSCDLLHVSDDSFCTECDEHWYPLDLSSPQACGKFCIPSGDIPEECDGTNDCVQCSGHGSCTDEGNCLCEGAYTGDQCQILCAGQNGLICNGHGKCGSNDVQQLMEHEFRELGNVPLYSCTCDPQDPVDADSRIDWDDKLAAGLVNGTLEPPPNPEFFGATCDFSCVKPPWEGSSECNGMGNCTIIPIRSPTDQTFICQTDLECQNALEIQQIISGDATWSNRKGPFCHKLDNIEGCQKSTDDCYEILLKQRPRKMRSEVCVSNSTCYAALEAENWFNWCTEVQEEIQPPLFESCKSVSSFCPARTIPTYCKPLVDYTDGADVSYKLNFLYEYDKKHHPFLISEEYRSNESTIEHDDAEVAFSDFPYTVDYTITDQVCSNIKNRYPSITTVRENKQYICDGVIVDTKNCSGTLDNSINVFYNPFFVVCENYNESYKTYDEAMTNRPTNCKIVELEKEKVNVTETGHNHIDTMCQAINRKFPSCTYPSPCDFNPCSDTENTCVNEGTKAICSTMGDLNSTCKVGTSERLTYSSYSCDIAIPETSCPNKITHKTNLAKHCKDNSPIVDTIQTITDGQTKTFTPAEYIHFHFKASDTITTGSRLEFGDAIRIYVRQGQIQVNEAEILQSCPITDIDCHNIWNYNPDDWYYIELKINSTHVTMKRKDTGATITKELLSQNPITQAHIQAGSSVVTYKNIYSEQDIVSPFDCTYQTCDLDVSYREICSDIERNIEYPTLLEPTLDPLTVCSNYFENTRLDVDEDYVVTEQIYELNWDTYCDFYISLNNTNGYTQIAYTVLEDYNKCQEFVDPMDGDKTCIDNALDYDWGQSCQDLLEAQIPDTIKNACPKRCYNHLVDYRDCDDMFDIFYSDKTVIDDTECTVDWYDYCLKDSKNMLDGVCSAVECSCDFEQYEGISGEACELHCPVGTDGTACAEGRSMGKCVYTEAQLQVIETGKKDIYNDSLAFDKVRSLEGECQCFISEGDNSCDIECFECGEEKYTGGQNSICDNARGVCTCLPPFTEINNFTVVNWRGKNSTQIERSYNTGNLVGKDLFRMRMMQGKEVFTTRALEVSPGVLAYNGTQKWQTIFYDFIDNPENYWCLDHQCEFGDSTLASNLDETSSKYNFDCSSTCPGTNGTSKIPCSGRGICGATGQCICDPATVVIGEGERGFKEVFQVVPGVQVINSKIEVSSLDRTGYRGDGCQFTCRGYDEEKKDMSTICSGHGKCDLAGECACELGYIGLDCEFKCPGFEKGDRNVCNGHGTCQFASLKYENFIFPGVVEKCKHDARKVDCMLYAELNDQNFTQASEEVNFVTTYEYGNSVLTMDDSHCIHNIIFEPIPLDCSDVPPSAASCEEEICDIGLVTYTRNCEKCGCNSGDTVESNCQLCGSITIGSYTEFTTVETPVLYDDGTPQIDPNGDPVVTVVITSNTYDKTECKSCLVPTECATCKSCFDSNASTNCRCTKCGFQPMPNNVTVKYHNEESEFNVPIETKPICTDQIEIEFPENTNATVRMFRVPDRNNGTCVEPGRWEFYNESAEKVCITRKIANMDQNIQYSLLTGLKKYNENCSAGEYQDILTGNCQTPGQNPMIKTEFYSDIDTIHERKIETLCSIQSTKELSCAVCDCFNDDTVGFWGNVICESCLTAYGNEQCLKECPGGPSNMCNGNGACLYGSILERELYQPADCSCNQSSKPTGGKCTTVFMGSIESNQGIEGDRYNTIERASLECCKLDDISKIAVNNYCRGIFQAGYEYVLIMGYISNTKITYNALWEKEHEPKYVEEYTVETRDNYQQLTTTKRRDCSPLEDIFYLGKDVCPHYDSDDCSRCEEGFSGKDCSVLCQKCLLGGTCTGKPSDEIDAKCTCSSQKDGLWEFQCCPVGFKVTKMLDWNSKPQEQINEIKITQQYDVGSTNELDASFWCDSCPGIIPSDWLDNNAFFSVCMNRGECVSNRFTMENQCQCEDEWAGLSCTCHPDSTAPFVNLQTPYGCTGNTRCVSTGQRYLIPEIIRTTTYLEMFGESCFAKAVNGTDIIITNPRCVEYPNRAQNTERLPYLEDYVLSFDNKEVFGTYREIVLDKLMVLDRSTTSYSHYGAKNNIYKNIHTHKTCSSPIETHSVSLTNWDFSVDQCSEKCSNQTNCNYFTVSAYGNDNCKLFGTCVPSDLHLSYVFELEIRNIRDECSERYPCHMGVGPCATDSDCAGTLTCEQGETEYFDLSKVMNTFKYCSHPNTQSIACTFKDSTQYETNGVAVSKDSLIYSGRFYYDGEFKENIVFGNYSPIIMDANDRIILQPETYTCPKGSYPIPGAPTDYGHGMNKSRMEFEANGLCMDNTKGPTLISPDNGRPYGWEAAGVELGYCTSFTVDYETITANADECALVCSVESNNAYFKYQAQTQKCHCRGTTDRSYCINTWGYDRFDSTGCIKYADTVWSEPVDGYCNEGKTWHDYNGYGLDSTVDHCQNKCKYDDDCNHFSVGGNCQISVNNMMDCWCVIFTASTCTIGPRSGFQTWTKLDQWDTSFTEYKTERVAGDGTRYLEDGYCADYAAASVQHTDKTAEECGNLCATAENARAYGEYYIHNEEDKTCYCGHSGSNSVSIKSHNTKCLPDSVGQTSTVSADGWTECISMAHREGARFVTYDMTTYECIRTTTCNIDPTTFADYSTRLWELDCNNWVPYEARIVATAEGSPTLDLDQAACKAYGESIGKWEGPVSTTNSAPRGCWRAYDGDIQYTTSSSNTMPCLVGDTMCVQMSVVPPGESFGYKTYKNEFCWRSYEKVMNEFSYTDFLSNTEMLQCYDKCKNYGRDHIAWTNSYSGNYRHCWCVNEPCPTDQNLPAYTDISDIFGLTMLQKLLTGDDVVIPPQNIEEIVLDTDVASGGYQSWAYPDTGRRSDGTAYMVYDEAGKLVCFSMCKTLIYKYGDIWDAIAVGTTNQECYCVRKNSGTTEDWVSSYNIYNYVPVDYGNTGMTLQRNFKTYKFSDTSESVNTFCSMCPHGQYLDGNSFIDWEPTLDNGRTTHCSFLQENCDKCGGVYPQKIFENDCNRCGDFIEFIQSEACEGYYENSVQVSYATNDYRGCNRNWVPNFIPNEYYPDPACTSISCSGSSCQLTQYHKDCRALTYCPAGGSVKEVYQGSILKCPNSYGLSGTECWRDYYTHFYCQKYTMVLTVLPQTCPKCFTANGCKTCTADDTSQPKRCNSCEDCADTNWFVPPCTACPGGKTSDIGSSSIDQCYTYPTKYGEQEPTVLNPEDQPNASGTNIFYNSMFKEKGGTPEYLKNYFKDGSEWKQCYDLPSTHEFCEESKPTSRLVDSLSEYEEDADCSVCGKEDRTLQRTQLWLKGCTNEPMRTSQFAGYRCYGGTHTPYTGSHWYGSEDTEVNGNYCGWELLPSLKGTENTWQNANIDFWESRQDAYNGAYHPWSDDSSQIPVSRSSSNGWSSSAGTSGITYYNPFQATCRASYYPTTSGTDTMKNFEFNMGARQIDDTFAETCGKYNHTWYGEQCYAHMYGIGMPGEGAGTRGSTILIDDISQLPGGIDDTPYVVHFDYLPGNEDAITCDVWSESTDPWNNSRVYEIPEYDLIRTGYCADFSVENPITVNDITYLHTVNVETYFHTVNDKTYLHTLSAPMTVDECYSACNSTNSIDSTLTLVNAYSVIDTGFCPHGAYTVFDNLDLEGCFEECLQSVYDFFLHRPGGSCFCGYTKEKTECSDWRESDVYSSYRLTTYDGCTCQNADPSPPCVSPDVVDNSTCPVFLDPMTADECYNACNSTNSVDSTLTDGICTCQNADPSPPCVSPDVVVGSTCPVVLPPITVDECFNACNSTFFTLTDSGNCTCGNTNTALPCHNWIEDDNITSYRTINCPHRLFFDGICNDPDVHPLGSPIFIPVEDPNNIDEGYYCTTKFAKGTSQFFATTDELRDECANLCFADGYDSISVNVNNGDCRCTSRNSGCNDTYINNLWKIYNMVANLTVDECAQRCYKTSDYMAWKPGQCNCYEFDHKYIVSDILDFMGVDKCNSWDYTTGLNTYEIIDKTKCSPGASDVPYGYTPTEELYKFGNETISIEETNSSSITDKFLTLRECKQYASNNSLTFEFGDIESGSTCAVHNNKVYWVDVGIKEVADSYCDDDWAYPVTGVNYGEDFYIATTLLEKRNCYELCVEHGYNAIAVEENNDRCYCVREPCDNNVTTGKTFRLLDTMEMLPVEHGYCEDEWVYPTGDQFTGDFYDTVSEISIMECLDLCIANTQYDHAFVYHSLGDEGKCMCVNVDCGTLFEGDKGTTYRYERYEIPIKLKDGYIYSKSSSYLTIDPTSNYEIWNCSEWCKRGSVEINPLVYTDGKCYCASNFTNTLTSAVATPTYQMSGHPMVLYDTAATMYSMARTDRETGYCGDVDNTTIVQNASQCETNCNSGRYSIGDYDPPKVDNGFGESTNRGWGYCTYEKLINSTECETYAQLNGYSFQTITDDNEANFTIIEDPNNNDEVNYCTSKFPKDTNQFFADTDELRDECGNLCFADGWDSISVNVNNGDCRCTNRNSNSGCSDIYNNYWKIYNLVSSNFLKATGCSRVGNEVYYKSQGTTCGHAYDNDPDQCGTLDCSQWAYWSRDCRRSCCLENKAAGLNELNYMEASNPKQGYQIPWMKPIISTSLTSSDDVSIDVDVIRSPIMDYSNLAIEYQLCKDRGYEGLAVDWTTGSNFCANNIVRCYTTQHPKNHLARRESPNLKLYIDKHEIGDVTLGTEVCFDGSRGEMDDLFSDFIDPYYTEEELYSLSPGVFPSYQRAIYKSYLSGTNDKFWCLKTNDDVYCWMTPLTDYPGDVCGSSWTWEFKEPSNFEGVPETGTPVDTSCSCLSGAPSKTCTNWTWDTSVITTKPTAPDVTPVVSQSERSILLWYDDPDNGWELRNVTVDDLPSDMIIDRIQLPCTTGLEYRDYETYGITIDKWKYYWEDDSNRDYGNQQFCEGYFDPFQSGFIDGVSESYNEHWAHSSTGNPRNTRGVTSHAEYIIEQPSVCVDNPTIPLNIMAPDWVPIRDSWYMDYSQWANYDSYWKYRVRWEERLSSVEARRGDPSRPGRCKPNRTFFKSIFGPTGEQKGCGKVGTLTKPVRTVYPTDVSCTREYTHECTRQMACNDCVGEGIQATPMAYANPELVPSNGKCTKCYGERRYGEECPSLIPRDYTYEKEDCQVNYFVAGISYRYSGVPSYQLSKEECQKNAHRIGKVFNSSIANENAAYGCIYHGENVYFAERYMIQNSGFQESFLNENECNEYATNQSFSFETTNSSSVPFGCSVWESSVFYKAFSQNLTSVPCGSAFSSGNINCVTNRPDTTECSYTYGCITQRGTSDFRLKHKGKPDTRYQTTIEECQEFATNHVQKHFKGTLYTPHKPSGCFMDIGFVYYNNKTSSGKEYVWDNDNQYAQRSYWYWDQYLVGIQRSGYIDYERAVDDYSYSLIDTGFCPHGAFTVFDNLDLEGCFEECLQSEYDFFLHRPGGSCFCGYTKEKTECSDWTTSDVYSSYRLTSI